MGGVTGQALEQLGVPTIGQVRNLRVEILHQHFGKADEHKWQLAHGIDDRTVIPDRGVDSILHGDDDSGQRRVALVPSVSMFWHRAF